MAKTSKRTWTGLDWKNNKYLESSIQKYILGELKKNCAYAIKVVKGNEAGISDLLVCYNGVFIAMEIKTVDNVATPLQKRHLELVRQAGGISGEVRCWKDAEKLLYEAETLIAQKFGVPIRPYKGD